MNGRGHVRVENGIIVVCGSLRERKMKVTGMWVRKIGRKRRYKVNSKRGRERECEGSR